MGNNNSSSKELERGKTQPNSQNSNGSSVVYTQNQFQHGTRIQSVQGHHAHNALGNNQHNFPSNFSQDQSGEPFQSRTHSNMLYPNPSLSQQLPAYNNGQQLTTTSVENVHYDKEPIHEVNKPLQRTKNVIDAVVLLELSGKETLDIVRQLKNEKYMFANTLHEPISNSLLIVLMKIVRKICMSNSLDDKIDLLKVVCSDHFLNTLGDYIINIPTHQQDCAKEDLLFLEGSALPFFETVLLLIPNIVCVKLQTLLIKTNLAINGLEQYQNLKIDDVIKMKLKNMESSVKRHLNIQEPDDKLEQGPPKQTSAEQKNKSSGASQTEPPIQTSAEQNNKKSGASQTAAEVKHIQFLTRNVFPNIIKKLDVPAHKVRGLRKNLYFIDCGNRNEESEFLVGLVQYLLKHSYKANNILLLTTDELKMKHVNEIKDKITILKNLKVGVINTCEDFAATIILIALDVNESEDTRQNIYAERQLCKAFLGAKNGIYMMGNLTVLEKQTPFWKEMKSLLQQYECVSSALPLLCEAHQMVMTVNSAQDFGKIKRSGCSQRCNKQLSCDHLCKRLCHLDDREHKNYKCREPCSRKRSQCSSNHKCSKHCHEPCELCTISVVINNKTVACHEISTLQKSTVVSSDHQKNELLPCGHKTSKELNVIKMDIWSVELVNFCQVPCSATLLCGHVCTGTCGSCRQGRVHMPCRDKTKIALACGHSVMTTCSSVIRECNQKCFYECPHGMCKEKCGVPCTPCKEMCVIGCEHSHCTKKCNELCNRRPCFESCKKLLACGHPCIGFCGEVCPPGPEYCRTCSADKMKKKDSSGSARFVFLSNCKHVVRANDLDRRAFTKSFKVQALTCPLCGFAITKTSRYLNYAKQLHQNLFKIRGCQKRYKENITVAFWNLAKEIRSFSLPQEIEDHPKMDEIKKQFQVVKDNKMADHKEIVLLMFLRNLLHPIVDGQTGMASANHLNWFLYVLLERYEMGLCSQVLRELYKEIVLYQKMKGSVYKRYLLELHRAIAFFIMTETNTWMKCDKGHLSSYGSLLTECSTCDEEK